MTRTLSRRLLLRALGVSLVGVAATRLVPSVRAQQPRIDPLPTGTPNVWAATMGGIAEGVADLPPRVYVPHENGGDVAVIDPATRTIVDRFAVGRTPHHVTPAYDLSSLYVNVMGASRMVQIDPWAGRPVRSMPVASPYNLYWTLDGGMGIVAAEPANRLDF